MLTVPTFWIVCCTLRILLQLTSNTTKWPRNWQMFISEVLDIPPMPFLLPVAFCQLHILRSCLSPRVFPPNWWKNNVSLQMLHLYKQWSAMPSERPFCKKQTNKKILAGPKPRQLEKHTNQTLLLTPQDCKVVVLFPSGSETPRFFFFTICLQPKKKKLLSPCAWAHPFMTSSLYEYFGALLELQLKSLLICISPAYCDVNPHPAVG